LDGIANTLWSLARIDLQREDYQAAFERLTKSYDILLKLGRLDGICWVGLDLGQLLCRCGRGKEGKELFKGSEEGFLKLGRADLAEQVRKLLDRPD
jgi:hypothetical protein